MASNGTVQLPPGASNHGVPEILCLPARWTDVLSFFLLNYVAHAATVVLEPGSSPYDTFISVLTALMLPGAGLYSALRSIVIGIRNWTSSDLERALAAEALCADEDAFKSVRDEDGDYFLETRLVDMSRHWVFRKQLHGLSDVDSQRPLIILPPQTTLSFYTHSYQFKLGTNRSLVKTLLTMAQVGYGVYTLYTARGNQIDRYGYAAFGLSVAPYALMSIVNGIANLLMPSWSNLYLVELSTLSTSTSTESRFSGNRSSGDVLCCTHTSGAVRRSSTIFEFTSEADKWVDAEESLLISLLWGSDLWLLLVTILLGSIPLIIVGVLTNFQSGTESYPYQRGWMLTWLVSGILAGPFVRGTRGNTGQPMLAAILSPFVIAAMALDERIGSNKIVGPLLRVLKKAFTIVFGLAVAFLNPDYLRTIADADEDKDSVLSLHATFLLLNFVGVAAFAIPSIGGMVVVAKMIMSYGVCQRLDAS